MKYVNLFAAVCVVLLMPHPALAFSDFEFDNADWELTVLTDGPPPLARSRRSKSHRAETPVPTVRSCTTS